MQTNKHGAINNQSSNSQAFTRIHDLYPCVVFFLIYFTLRIKIVKDNDTDGKVQKPKKHKKTTELITIICDAAIRLKRLFETTIKQH